MLEGSQPKTTTINSNKIKAEYIYEVTEEQVKHVLDNLDQKYLDNYSDWLKVTSVLKHHDMYDIWDTWSKQSTHYNKSKNIKSQHKINTLRSD